MAGSVDPDAYTTPFQLTKTTHRDPYPAISPDKPENSKEGKIVVITGGGSGLGAASAKVWARAKVSGIVVCGRRQDKLDQVTKELQSINGSVKVLTVQVDVTNDKEVENLFAQVQKTFGRPADVVLNNAGFYEERNLIGEQDVNGWWESITVNLKGLMLITHHYIKSQPDPKNPVGTIVATSSGVAGLLTPGASGYGIAKLAQERFTEFANAEYPTLRVFTIMPGIVPTDMTQADFVPYAHDHADLCGMLSLYLSQSRADYLRGGLISVNWDVEEMEAHQKEIQEKNLLKISWLPVLPISGGPGVGK